MKLSRDGRYAIVALAHLASTPPGTVMEAAGIAEAAGLPAPFLSKILPKLTRRGVLTSFRGKRRGYTLARPAADISMKVVLEAVEGPDLFSRCVFWSDECSDERPCPLHPTWKTLRSQIAEAMERTTLQDIAFRFSSS